MNSNKELLLNKIESLKKKYVKKDA
jgi:hypothetical protein